MNSLALLDMNRDDLIATVKATRSKLDASEAKQKASQERIGTLEARVKQLTESSHSIPTRTMNPNMRPGLDDIHDD